jgi:hypothetical protein
MQGPQELPWRFLQAIDSDLHLQVEQLLTGGLEVDNLKTVISLVDGDLEMPLSFAVAKIPVEGHVEMLKVFLFILGNTTL